MLVRTRDPATKANNSFTLPDNRKLRFIGELTGEFLEEPKRNTFEPNFCTFQDVQVKSVNIGCKQVFDAITPPHLLAG